MAASPTFPPSPLVNPKPKPRYKKFLNQTHRERERMDRSEGSSTSPSRGEDTPKPKPWQSYHTVYTNAKAGMDGVDRERVQRIVYETSKGSKYFENEEKKEAFMRQKIESMRTQCSKLTQANLSHFQKVAEKRIFELEAMRDLSRIWLHVDMDAFYAAVETLSDPSLKGKPMAVGSMSMISTANYEARKFGVRAAMPGFIARKLCPELIFVPIDFTKYTYYSELTRKVFKDYDPHFMAASLDEAYLDITEVCRERGITGGEIAEELRNRVYEETGLTCSAGMAPNRLLAKVCSDIKKPNGQFVLPNDRMAVMTFISSLPIRKIGGIGKVTEHILKDALGINTCEEILQKGNFLCALFSRSTADFFLSVGLGLGGTNTPEVRFRKSISSERTFLATNDEALLYQKLAEIAEMLHTDMQKEGLCGRTLTLKLKTSTFEVRTRALTLQKYISSSEDILKYGSKLLKAELPISLRLIGLRVSHFKENKDGSPSDPTQKTLTNFILSRDTSKQSSVDTDVSHLDSMCDVEKAFSFDSHEWHHSEFRDPLDIHHFLDDSHCSINNDIEGELHKNMTNIDTEKTRNTDATSCDSETHQTAVSAPAGMESRLPGQLEETSENLMNKEINNEADMPSESKGRLFWIDDYKCPLCGIEMPPDFVDERQEHSDFHMAERLQMEEPSSGSRTFTLLKRRSRKDEISKESRRKKLKPSGREGRHLPIDAFFAKSDWN